MIGPSLIAALVAGQTLVLDLGLRTETRGGQSNRDVIIDPSSPLSPQEQVDLQRGTIIEIDINPTMRMRYDLGRTELATFLSTRLFHRFITRVPERPLISTVAEATLDHAVSRATALQFGVSGGIGELDLSAPDLSPDSASVPIAVGIINFQNLAGTTGWSYAPSRDLSFALRLDGTYNAPLETLTASSAIPRTLRAVLTAITTYQAGRDDNFEYSISAEQADVANGPVGSNPDGQYRIVNTRLGWAHRFSRDVEGGLGAGMAALFRPPGASPQGFERDAVTFLPVFDIAFRDDIYNERVFTLGYAIGLGIAPYLDPFRGVVESRANLSLTFEIGFPLDDLNARIAAVLTNPATFSDAPESDVTGAAEAVLSVRTPVTYELSDGIILEGGGQILARGPRITSGAGLDQTDFLAYVALSIAWTTQSR